MYFTLCYHFNVKYYFKYLKFTACAYITKMYHFKLRDGERAGCLRCMMGCNESFFASSRLFALERESAANGKVTLSLPSLLLGVVVGGTWSDQILCPAVMSCFFEAVWLFSATLAAPRAAIVCRVLLHRTMALFEVGRERLLNTHILIRTHESSHYISHSYSQNLSQDCAVILWLPLSQTLLSTAHVVPIE